VPPFSLQLQHQARSQPQPLCNYILPHYFDLSCLHAIHTNSARQSDTGAAALAAAAEQAAEQLAEQLAEQHATQAAAQLVEQATEQAAELAQQEEGGPL
jgi:hypothetical protein